MIKIGFIDYYLDEWHANNYPEMIYNLGGGEFEVCCAYGHIDSPIGGITNKEWSKKYNIPLEKSIEKVIEKSDCIVVLSPDNPEMHEELSRLPLESGKRIYIDKTFAPDTLAAKRIFEYADKFSTPVYSCSSLCFSAELDAMKEKNIKTLYANWGGGFKHQFIHVTEPILSVMGTNVKRIMCVGSQPYESFTLEFADGKDAHIGMCGKKLRFIEGCEDGTNENITVESPYFELFIKAMLEFFKTGIIPVPHEQTIAVIAVIEAAKKARENPYEWFEIKK